MTDESLAFGEMRRRVRGERFSARPDVNFVVFRAFEELIERFEIVAGKENAFSLDSAGLNGSRGRRTVLEERGVFRDFERVRRDFPSVREGLVERFFFGVRIRERRERIDDSVDRRVIELFAFLNAALDRVDFFLDFGLLFFSVAGTLF